MKKNYQLMIKRNVQRRRVIEAFKLIVLTIIKNIFSAQQSREYKLFIISSN